MVVDAQLIESNILFTTSGALVESVDKKILLLLRDGRKLIGVMRSYDQFANLVLQDTVERVFVGGRGFVDLPRGMYVVRGENVVMLGEVVSRRDLKRVGRGMPREARVDLMIHLSLHLGPRQRPTASSSTHPTGIDSFYNRGVRSGSGFEEGERCEESRDYEEGEGIL